MLSGLLRSIPCGAYLALLVLRSTASAASITGEYFEDFDDGISVFENGPHSGHVDQVFRYEDTYVAPNPDYFILYGGPHIALPAQLPPVISRSFPFKVSVSARLTIADLTGEGALLAGLSISYYDIGAQVILYSRDSANFDFPDDNVLAFGIIPTTLTAPSDLFVGIDGNTEYTLTLEGIQVNAPADTWDVLFTVSDGVHTASIRNLYTRKSPPINELITLGAPLWMSGTNTVTVRADFDDFSYAPEPGSSLLVSTGVVLVAAVRRRRAEFGVRCANTK